MKPNSILQLNDQKYKNVYPAKDNAIEKNIKTWIPIRWYIKKSRLVQQIPANWTSDPDSLQRLISFVNDRVTFIKYFVFPNNNIEIEITLG